MIYCRCLLHQATWAISLSYFYHRYCGSQLFQCRLSHYGDNYQHLRRYHRFSKDEKLRKSTHLGVAILFVIFIILFKQINSTSVIDAIYIICSYTYGPLLGIFGFGIFTKRRANDQVTPYIAILSPIICYAIDWYSSHHWATNWVMNY